MAVRTAPARFDRVARVYRAMEYLSFGPLLERCRFYHLRSLAALQPEARKALVFGDGDGRFLARLLTAATQVHAEAVDASPAMLRLARAHVKRSGAEARLKTICTDARTFMPADADYDCVATHFFLDCLTESEAEDLVHRLRPHLAPGALWLVSEFDVPAGGRLRATAARSLIAALYAAFRLLTGLRVRRIPPWRAILNRSGFTRVASHTLMGGVLVTEIWQLQRATASACGRSQQEMPSSSELVTTPGSVPGIDPGPEPAPGPPDIPVPEPAPGPPPEPDPQPYPGPIPAPQPVTRTA